MILLDLTLLQITHLVTGIKIIDTAFLVGAVLLIIYLLKRKRLTMEFKEFLDENNCSVYRLCKNTNLEQMN